MEAMKEIIRLKEELEKEKIHRLRLEDELDLLAVDNDRLRNLVASGGSSSMLSFTSKNTSNHSSNSGGGLIGNFSSNSTESPLSTDSDWRELLVDGDGNCADSIHTTIENACGGMNALCVAFCSYPGYYPLL
jgi:hypothetical protein